MCHILGVGITSGCVILKVLAITRLISYVPVYGENNKIIPPVIISTILKNVTSFSRSSVVARSPSPGPQFCDQLILTEELRNKITDFAKFNAWAVFKSFKNQPLNL